MNALHMNRRRARTLGVVLLWGVATACFAGGGLHIGTVVGEPPHGFVRVRVGGTPYFYHRGFFYQSYGPDFVVVTAPMGAVIGSLPPNHIWITTPVGPYAYYYGTFYEWRDRDRRYAVARPPRGARVPSLPRRARSIREEGVEYKEYAGVYYKRDRDGYEVVAPPRRRAPRR